MRYYKTPAQEQAVTKATDFELLSWVHMRKTTALMLHNYYREVLCWLGLPTLAKVQKCRFLTEYEEQIEIGAHMRQMWGMMPNIDTPRESLEIDTFKIGGKTSVESISKQDKEKVLRRIIIDWKDWEKETIDVLSDIATELRKRGSVASAIFVEELIEDTLEEAQMAISLHEALQNANFSLDAVYSVQNILQGKAEED